MSENRRIESARRFHDATTHTPYSVRTSTHTLDWDVKPLPFKIYVDLPAIPLPRTFGSIDVDTFAAIDGRGATTSTGASPRLTLETLAAVLYHAAGITKKKAYPGGGEVLFRAAASTGALYQTEVYLAVGDVEDLAPGLYHFGPGDFALRRLRDGDVRAPLAAAAAEQSIASAAATVILSGLYWRNTWKYQARGYRHLFWDSGTMLANLLAAGNARALAPRLVTGFVDADVNRLLGLDADREAALELVVLAPGASPTAPPSPVGAVDHAVVPLSDSEVDYPLLREAYLDSRLTDAEEVRRWRAGLAPTPREPRGALTALPPPRTTAGRSLTDTVHRRGSTRRFARTPIAADELATVLWCATRPVDADVAGSVVELFLVVNAVDAIAPGAYRFLPAAHALELVKAGSYRNESGYLCLEQSLGADASAVIYFLTPLGAVLEAFGNRGYRVANLQAGLAGGRAYLAAYGQGFGASGLTFYDRQVVDFFAPASDGLDAIFVVALGRSATGAPEALSGLTQRIKPGVRS